MSGIDFDDLLETAQGDYQVAGYIAALIQGGRCNKTQAINMHNDARVNLEILRQSFEESGDGRSVLAAINLCIGVYNYPIPAWAKNGWSEAYGPWTTGDIKTLDEALGINRAHLKALQKQRYATLIWQYVNNRRKAEGKENVPIGDLLFEEAADYVNQIAPDELKISKTAASNLYYGLLNHVKSFEEKAAKARKTVLDK